MTGVLILGLVDTGISMGISLQGIVFSMGSGNCTVLTDGIIILGGAISAVIFLCLC